MGKLVLVDGFQLEWDRGTGDCSRLQVDDFDRDGGRALAGGLLGLCCGRGWDFSVDKVVCSSVVCVVRGGNVFFGGGAVRWVVFDGVELRVSDQLIRGGGRVVELHVSGWGDGLAAVAAELAAGADAEKGAEEDCQSEADACVQEIPVGQLVPGGEVKVDDGCLQLVQFGGVVVGDEQVLGSGGLDWRPGGREVGRDHGGEGCLFW